MKVTTFGGRRPIWLLLAVFCLGPGESAWAQMDDDTFRGIVAELGDANFREKEAIAARLIDTAHPGVRNVVTALMDGRVFIRDRDGQAFVVESTAEDLSEFTLLDPASAAEVGSSPPGQLSRVITNNQLRRFLRTAVARFSLSSADASVRRDAVREILRSLDAGNVELLRARAEEEEDADVAYEIETALALVALDDEDTRVRSEAVGRLVGRLNPEVRNRLATLVESDEEGRFVEPDPGVRAAAAEALQGIDQWRSLFSLIETAFFGLSLGSVLVLVAIGLAITIGMRLLERYYSRGVRLGGAR